MPSILKAISTSVSPLIAWFFLCGSSFSTDPISSLFFLCSPRQAIRNSKPTPLSQLLFSPSFLRQFSIFLSIIHSSWQFRSRVKVGIYILFSNYNSFQHGQVLFEQTAESQLYVLSLPAAAVKSAKQSILYIAYTDVRGLPCILWFIRHSRAVPICAP